MELWALTALLFLLYRGTISQSTTQTSREGGSEFVSNLFLQGPPEEPQPLTRLPPIQRLRLSESCLACLCAASTSCQLGTRCVNGGQYCGPFLISKPYWLDAGSPVLLGDSPERDGAFSDCAMDPICSAQTVRKYMTKFQKDCNGNGEVDCDDLARIHLMGPFSAECGRPLVDTSVFYQKFQKCWDSVIRLSPPPEQTPSPATTTPSLL